MCDNNYIDDEFLELLSDTAIENEAAGVVVPHEDGIPMLGVETLSTGPSIQCDRYAVGALGQQEDCRLTREAMEKYLRYRCDMVLGIKYTKVVRKSYGKERRFFCPPPCVCFYKDRMRLSQEQLEREGESEESTKPCGFIGIINSGQYMQPVDLKNGEEYCAAKTLSISDFYKSKNLMLFVKICHENGQCIGIFTSKTIKVMSHNKSKRMHNNNDDEFCIKSGTEVALYNRPKCYGAYSRYLHVEDGKFHASNTEWGAFTIHLLDDNEQESDDFAVVKGYIHYGSTVKLVCAVTGMALPRLIIRKVERQKTMLEADNPVFELQQCAFYFKETDRMYLGFSEKRIILLPAMPSVEDPNKEMINKEACWTIISTDKIEYRYYEGMGPVRSPVSPIPVVHNVSLNGGGAVGMLELTGENFSPHLRVWFEDVESETMYRCQESLVCVVPEFSYVPGQLFAGKESVEISLYLVRNDGIIYPTGSTFTYIPQCHRQQHSQAVEEIMQTPKFALPPLSLLFDTPLPHLFEEYKNN